MGYLPTAGALRLADAVRTGEEEWTVTAELAVSVRPGVTRYEAALVAVGAGRGRTQAEAFRRAAAAAERAAWKDRGHGGKGPWRKTRTGGDLGRTDDGLRRRLRNETLVLPFPLRFRGRP